MSVAKSFVFGVLFFSSAYAYNIPYAACFYESSLQYNVPENLLVAIAKVESDFQPDLVYPDANGTEDIGIMQINTSWNSLLHSYGISTNWLFDPCYNISFGAYVLRKCINQYGYTWKSVDCYNKGPGDAHNTSLYTWKVYEALTRY